MANALVKMKTGSISKLEQMNGNLPIVPLDEGSIYFAVDTSKNIGKIVYDAPDGHGGVSRITMSKESLVSAKSDGLMSAADKNKLDSGLTIAGNQLAIGGNLTANSLRASLGLANAMRFIGHATVAIEDKSTIDPEILNYDFGVNGENAQAGDVVIDDDTAYEYIWSSLGRWERLGPNGDYALSNHNHSYIKPTGITTRIQDVTLKNNNVLIGVKTAGTVPSLGTAFTIPNIGKKTVVTDATFNTVMLKATVTNEVLSFFTGVSGSAIIGDSVVEGTPFLVPNITDVGTMPTFNTGIVEIDNQPEFTAETITANTNI